LNDARSIAVGYGPVCAEKFGLPWGETRQDADESANNQEELIHV
jgi:hypothetical protein